MTKPRSKPLPELSRDISPIALERDDHLITLMAEVLDYARSAHRVIDEVVSGAVQTSSGASTYAHLHVPGEAWLQLRELARRPRPALIDEADAIKVARHG